MSDSYVKNSITTEEKALDITAEVTTAITKDVKANSSECLLICYDAFLMFEILVNIFAHGALSVFGIVGNLVNMYIFLKQKLNDNMTIELFSLSLTDFTVSVIDLGMAMTYLANYLFPESPIDLWALSYIYFGWGQYAGYLISSWITAMISIERYLCVVAPFRVGQILTRRRCIAILASILVVHIACFTPVCVADKMGWVDIEPPCENCTFVYSSHFTVTFSELSEETEMALEVVAGIFLFITSQALLIICSFWMTFSLKTSSSVRSTQETTGKNHSPAKNKHSQLTTKERKLIAMVLSLAVLQTACNLPRLVLTLLFCTFPGISGTDDKYLSTLLWTIASLFNQICCTCNTVCYYFMNSKHRTIFRETFCGKAV